MSGNAEQLSASVIGASEGREPGGSSAHDSRADSHSFDVGDCGGTVEDTNVSREGRF